MHFGQMNHFTKFVIRPASFLPSANQWGGGKEKADQLGERQTEIQEKREREIGR